MENKKDNLLLALLLSLLVGAVGALIWGIIYMQGWYVSLIAFASAFGMYTVYSKFAKVNTLTFVWVLLVVIALDTVATYLAIILQVSNIMDMNFADSLNYVNANFDLIKGDFISDCLMGTLFGVIGVVSAHKTIKNKRENA